MEPTRFHVHRRATRQLTQEHEQQLCVEDAARAFGYKLTYQVYMNKFYDVFVELDSDLEFIEFKLRCSP